MKHDRNITGIQIPSSTSQALMKPNNAPSDLRPLEPPLSRPGPVRHVIGEERQRIIRDLVKRGLCGG